MVGAQQQQMLGDRLLPVVQKSHPKLAPKITEMLLEMDNSELLHLLEEDSAALALKVEEAVKVLVEHAIAENQPCEAEVKWQPPSTREQASVARGAEAEGRAGGADVAAASAPSSAGGGAALAALDTVADVILPVWTPVPSKTHTIEFDSSATGRIGHGSNGVTVYRGRTSAIRRVAKQRDVAIKRVLSEHSRLSDKEIAAYTQLRGHPNIVQFFGYESDGTFTYIFLELCDRTLQQHLQRLRESDDSTLWSPDVARRLTKQVVDGVAHVHTSMIKSDAEKTIHNDLHPGNVLVRDGTCKISDFGLARSVEAENSTQVFSTAGARPNATGWVAPEMILNIPGEISSKVDVFATGLIAFYIASKGARHAFG